MEKPIIVNIRIDRFFENLSINGGEPKSWEIAKKMESDIQKAFMDVIQKAAETATDKIANESCRENSANKCNNLFAGLHKLILDEITLLFLKHHVDVRPEFVTDLMDLPLDDIAHFEKEIKNDFDALQKFIEEVCSVIPSGNALSNHLSHFSPRFEEQQVQHDKDQPATGSVPGQEV